MTYPNNFQLSGNPSYMLGQTPGLGAPNISNAYTGPDLNFGGNYSGLGLNPNFQSVAGATGLDLSGLPTASGNGFGNWLANNSSLVNAGVGLFTGGFGAFNGMKQNSLLEKNMNMQASQFREQMDLSKQTMNRNMEDRQRARVASNPVAYEPVSEYMKKYGAK